MINLLGRLVAGFLSTIIFLAVFTIAGDVLVAAGVAMTGAAAQFAVAATAQQKPGAMAWASVVIVLVLTGNTLVGVTPPDGTLASRQLVRPVDATCPARLSTI